MFEHLLKKLPPVKGRYAVETESSTHNIMLVNPVFLLMWVESIVKSSLALKRTQIWEEDMTKMRN